MLVPIYSHCSRSHSYCDGNISSVSSTKINHILVVFLNTQESNAYEVTGSLTQRATLCLAAHLTLLIGMGPCRQSSPLLSAQWHSSPRTSTLCNFSLSLCHSNHKRLWFFFCTHDSFLRTEAWKDITGLCLMLAKIWASRCMHFSDRWTDWLLFWFSADAWHYLTGWVASVTIASTESGQEIFWKLKN